jgi:hypothetical protein
MQKQCSIKTRAGMNFFQNYSEGVEFPCVAAPNVPLSYLLIAQAFVTLFFKCGTVPFCALRTLPAVEEAAIICDH